MRVRTGRCKQDSDVRARGSSLKAGSMANRREAVAVLVPSFCESAIPPPGPCWSVLHSLAPFGDGELVKQESRRDAIFSQAPADRGTPESSTPEPGTR